MQCVYFSVSVVLRIVFSSTSFWLGSVIFVQKYLLSKMHISITVFCSASPANFCSTQKRHPQIWNLFSGDNGEKLVWWQVSCSSLLEERHSFLMLFCSSMFAMFVKYFCITVSMHFVKEVRHVKHCAVKASEVQVLYLF